MSPVEDAQIEELVDMVAKEVEHGFSSSRSPGLQSPGQ